MATLAFHLYCGRIYIAVVSMDGVCHCGNEINGRWSRLASGRFTGTFCIETCAGGMGVVAWSEWSLNKNGRMGRFNCITCQRNLPEISL